VIGGEAEPEALTLPGRLRPCSFPLNDKADVRAATWGSRSRDALLEVRAGIHLIDNSGTGRSVTCASSSKVLHKDCTTPH
jgi:hypothetical protein